MNRRGLQISLFLVVLVATSLFAGWYSLPRWLPLALNIQLAPYNYELTNWQFERPSFSEWRIHEIGISKKTRGKENEEPTIIATIFDIHIFFNPIDLLRRKIKHIQIDKLQWHNLPENKTSEEPATPVNIASITSSLAATDTYWPSSTLNIADIIIADKLLGNKVPINRASLSATSNEEAIKLILNAESNEVEAKLTVLFGAETTISMEAHDLADGHSATIESRIKLKNNQLTVTGKHTIDLAFIKSLSDTYDLTFLATQKERISLLTGIWSGRWNGSFNETLQAVNLTLDAEQQLNIDVSGKYGTANIKQPVHIQLQKQNITVTLTPSLHSMSGATDTVKQLSHRLQLPADKRLPMDWTFSINNPVKFTSKLDDTTHWNVTPINFSIESLNSDHKLATTGRLTLANLSPLNASVELSSNLSLAIPQWPTNVNTDLAFELSESNNELVLNVSKPINVNWKNWTIEAKHDKKIPYIKINNGQLVITSDTPIPLHELNQARGVIDLKMTPTINAVQYPELKLTAPWQLKDNKINLSSWQLLWDDLIGKGTATYHLKEKQGITTWKIHLPNAHQWITRYLTVIPRPLTLENGSLVTNGKLHWKQSPKIRFEIDASINASDWSGNWDNQSFMGASLKSNINLTEQLTMIGEQGAINIDRFNPGLPIENIKSTFSWSLFEGDADSFLVDVNDVSAQLLSGSISSVEAFKVSPSYLNTNINLALKQLSLADILALEQQPITGEGKLSGFIPIQLFDDSIVVNNGQISADAPGGWIKLEQSASFKHLAKGNEGLTLMFNALENFHYQSLESKVDYQTSGDLLLGVSVLGQNPSFKRAQSFDFNINIEENLKALFKSLQLSEDINERIGEKYAQ